MNTLTNQIKRTKVLKFKTTFDPTTMTDIICFWYISIYTRLLFSIVRCPAGRYAFFFILTLFRSYEANVCVKSNMRTRFVMDCCFSHDSNNTSAQQLGNNKIYNNYSSIPRFKPTIGLKQDFQPLLYFISRANRLYNDSTRMYDYE